MLAIHKCLYLRLLLRKLFRKAPLSGKFYMTSVSNEGVGGGGKILLAISYSVLYESTLKWIAQDAPKGSPYGQLVDQAAYHYCRYRGHCRPAPRASPSDDDYPTHFWGRKSCHW